MSLSGVCEEKGGAKFFGRMAMYQTLFDKTFDNIRLAIVSFISV